MLAVSGNARVFSNTTRERDREVPLRGMGNKCCPPSEPTPAMDHDLKGRCIVPVTIGWMVAPHSLGVGAPREIGGREGHQVAYVSA